MIPLVIARLTVHEAGRRRVLWVALALSAVFLIVYGIGMYFITQPGSGALPPNPAQAREILNGFLLVGLYAVNFMMGAMIVLASIDTISGEVASNAIHAVATKPVRRWQILIGKWLGFLAMLAGYVVLMLGGTMALVYGVAGYLPPNPLQGALLLFTEGALLLTLSILGGTFLSTLANGVMVFGLYGIAFVGGWTEQAGAFMHSEAAVNIGIISSLLMPTEALWKRAAFLMQGPLSRELGMNPFATPAAPSDAMVAYAVAYLAIALVVALRTFSRRDL